MIDSLYHLICLLFLDTPLLYYIILFIRILDHQYFSSFNLRSSVILCLSAVIIISFSKYFFFICFWIILWWSFWDFVNLSLILFRIRSPILFAHFWISLFESVLSASVEVCLAWSRKFWLYLLLTFLLIFLATVLLIFLTKDQNRLVELNNVALLGSKSVSFFICYTLINN